MKNNKELQQDIYNIAILASQVVIIGKELDVEKSDPGFVKLQKYRNSHLQVDIYFDSPSFTRIIQTKKVTETSLFSNIFLYCAFYIVLQVCHI